MNTQKLVFAVDKNSFYKEDHIGVRKKIETQLDVLRRNGIETEIAPYEWKDGIPSFKLGDKATVLYFRRLGASIRTSLMLLKMRRVNKDLRIIMEIPTYPFSGEETSNISLKQMINEKVGTFLWRFCIDRIVLIGNSEKKLFGVPVIGIRNGVDFEKVTIRNVSERDSINMIAVSGCFFWHGYDRMIKGLGEYYKSDHTTDVNLYLVGDGDCLDQYKRLSEEYGLTDKHVFFTGILSGEDLNRVYDECDLAVDCIGGHRKGDFFLSSLKSREYAAKGFPVVASSKLDTDTEETTKWFYRIPEDDSDVDIAGIVDYYNRIYVNKTVEGKSDIARQIRDTFRPLCDINDTFREVIEYIKVEKTHI